MRFQKRYILIFALVSLVTFIKFTVGLDDFVNVEQFRGADIQNGVFYPMIAQSINRNGLTVTLNGNTYTNETDGVYLDEQLNIMVPVRVLRESLHCSAHFYNENRLVILQGNRRIEMELDSYEMTFNDTKVEITSPMVTDGRDTYIPLQQLQDKLFFVIRWNSENNEAIGVTSSDADILPEKFDLRNYGRVGEVRNQGDLGTCWAFASLSALSSALLPEEDIMFSPDHMSLRNSFSSDQNNGGEYTMGMAYLTSWQGPVYERDDPYGDGMSPNGLTAVKHVQEIQFIDSGNLAEIKEAIFIYGAVQTSIYMKPSNELYYNKNNCAYYYNGKKTVNHDIVIVGWDDTYPASNFPIPPEGDGAFICQNSWGKEFGDGGFFYVSYYDTSICKHCICYTGIESDKNYDSIYQSDLCGYSGQLGYNKSEIYAANVFTSTHDEYLSAVGFYTTGKDTLYEIYIVTPFTDPDSLSEATAMLAASGKKEKKGYYTVKLNKNVQIKAGTKFAIMIRLETPGSTRPLAVEYKPKDDTIIDLLDGESYVSPNGLRWEHTEESHNCNICLKVYTSYRGRTGWKN
ncbi:MAG: cell surface protein [Lachnospiraceae bacterium]|nr:cell surface protein [Lachnospiraceae bacterium]